MRVVIDMQGAQTPFSAGRGVGRYTREMAKALICACDEQDEVFLALNGSYQEACDKLILEFENLLPADRIKIWQWYPVQEPACLAGVPGVAPQELYREWFLHQFHADIIWTPNFQEGFFDYNTAGTAGLIEGGSRICTTLHDVIPLIYKKDYLDGSDSREWYLKKIDEAKKCDFIITVSRFSKEKISEYLQIPEEKVHAVYEGADKEIFYKEASYLDQTKKEKTILYVGGADRHKNIKNLIKAFSLLPREIKNTYRLVFAGGEPEREKDQLLHMAAKCGVRKSSMAFLGYVSDDELCRLFQTCAVFVFPSYSEGFGLPILEAMECGAPVVAADAASIPEIVGDSRFMFDPFRPGDIADKIYRVLTEPGFALEAVKNGCRRAGLFSWQSGGRELYRIFKQQKKRENFSVYTNEMFYVQMAQLCSGKNISYQAGAAYSIENARLFREKRTIYIDTSAVVIEDYVTGIQRVVNGIISNLHEYFAGSSKVEVCPVYALPEQVHFIKSVFNGRKYVKREKITNADIVQFYDGDLFLMPDLAPGIVMAKEQYLCALVKRGVQVYTVLYDLIPIKYPDFFSRDFAAEYQGYLRSAAKFSGVIAISKATMDNYMDWCRENGIIFPPYFKNHYNYSGCDFIKANPTRGLKSGYEQVLGQMEKRPSFLVVSTLEPRKKQDQVLMAMEILWEKGVEANLVFVGRNGWQMEHFVNMIKQHKEKDRRLFWLEGISDEYLELLYEQASAVVAASLDEGYGLPVIEGAQHGKPLILRDIPVFRETAGEHAFYFKGEQAVELSDALKEWLRLYQADAVPKPEGIELVTWRQSVCRLLDLVNFKDVKFD